MKTITLFLILLMSFSTVSAGNGNSNQVAENKVNGTINVVSSPDLSYLANIWASEFNKTAMPVKVNIMNSDQASDGSLMLVTDEYLPEGNGWKMVIGHEVVVPVINASNPYLKDLMATGIRAEQFAEIITSVNNITWDNLIPSAGKEPVKLNITNQAALRKAIASFTKSNVAMMDKLPSLSAGELAGIIKSDVYAIGFIRFQDLLQSGIGKLPEGIVLLPIDKNSNGRLDRFEKIYSDQESFTRGVWVGKYPRTLCNGIYAVANEEPKAEAEVTFLTWLLKDGQNMLNTEGFTILSSNESRNNIISLTGAVELTPEPAGTTGNTALIIILAIIIITGIVTTLIVANVRKTNKAEAGKQVRISSALNENTITYPDGLFYDKSHTWAYMEKDGRVKMGLDDFMQHLTGKITKVIMKKPGYAFRKGEKIFTIVKDGKQLSFAAPINGFIRDQNTDLLNNPDLINSSPYDRGWIYNLIPINWLRETQFMFMSERYKNWLQDEFARLRDFMAASVKSNNSAYAHIVLQDGGELTDNVLADLEPEVWEEFQEKFIDTSR